ncbi:MAG: DUF3303 family protein [Gammaproteobacteria bacterium]|nr:DUF3303 family protein [Gammaproteobacteria bacterium]
MLYMLINRTKSNLTPEQYTQLGRLAEAFYQNVPSGLKLQGDWAANDGSRTFAMVETDDPELLAAVQAPFQSYVDIEIIAVTPLTGWNRR